METKQKLGQGQFFPQLEQSGNPDVWNSYNGITERRLIAKDVLCALLSNPRLYEQLEQIGMPVKDERASLVKAALFITDEFLSQESEDK